MGWHLPLDLFDLGIDGCCEITAPLTMSMKKNRPGHVPLLARLFCQGGPRFANKIPLERGTPTYVGTATAT
jgi:hypothetical protein